MKQSRTRQRLLSFVAAAALAVAGLVPTVALAEGAVAKIGSAEYPTLQAAVDAAKSGDTVTLIGDADPDVTVAVANKTITLDLAGRKIANTKDLWDQPTAQDNNWSLISVRENGNLTITGNGTLDAKKDDCYAVDLQDATAVCTIENGTFIGNVTAVYVSEGSLTINGGSYDIKQLNTNGVQDAYGVLINAYDNNFKSGAAKIAINGGTFKNFNPANNKAEQASGTSSLTGPDFKGIDNGDGTFSVAPKAYVAEVDGVKYETVNEAIAAANGKTVKLLDDVNEDVVVPSGVTVTLDLNGKTLTNVSSDTITNNGTLTIAGEGTVDNVTNGKAAILNKGTLNLEGGTITRSAEPEGQTPADGKGNSYYVVFNTSGATLNVKDGATVKGISAFSSAVRNDGNMTVSGGLIQQDDFIAVKNDSGTLVVKGGTIKSANDQAIQNWKDATIEGGELDGNVTSFAWGDEASSTKIAGGTINGDVSAINYIYNGKEATAAPVIEISGDAVVNGKLYAQKGTSANPAKNENVTSGVQATVTVSGGTFSDPVPSDMAAANYAPAKNSDGTYTVAPAEKIHKVTFVYGTDADDLVVEVVDGQAVAKPSDPSYEGWNFEGWFLVRNADGTLDVDSAYDFNTPVKGDMKIYAGWTEVKPADDGNTTNPEQPKPADGKAEQKPTAATPKTGDATNNAPLAVAVVAGAGLLAAGVVLGKRRER